MPEKSGGPSPWVLLFRQKEHMTMPKIKSHSGASKRFSVTKNGHVKYSHQNRRHILTKRSTKRKRGLRQGAYVADCIENNIKKLIPYA